MANTRNNLFVTRPLVSLLDAFVPTWCISCKAVGSLFCYQCRSKLVPRERLVTRASFDGWAAFDLDANVANLILAYKDRGRTALAEFLARRLLGPLSRFGDQDLTLVAMPSSSAGVARRGFDSAGLLVRALAKKSGLPMAKGLLTHRRETADQRPLAAADRESNLFESLEARQGQGRVLIVDDIVTTGASVLECRRALTSAGFEVAGFITIAETLLQKPISLRKASAQPHEWV